jgi:putative photosynthetic complex assembly protein
MADSPAMKRAGGPGMPVMALVTLVLTALLGTVWVRMSGRDIREPDAPVVMSRTLHFADRTAGAIDVTKSGSGALVQRIEGEQGFVRGTLRGFARERRARGVGPEAPFELVLHTDGRLTLNDPSTGRRVDLESFGPTNLAEFARLMDAPR